jgi:hypothetical protein
MGKGLLDHLKWQTYIDDILVEQIHQGFPAEFEAEFIGLIRAMPIRSSPRSAAWAVIAASSWPKVRYRFSKR